MKTNIILIIITCIGIIFLITPSNQSMVEHFRADKKPQEYMIDVFITTFTETGALKNQVSANYWAYLPEHQKSTFTKPHLKVYKPDGTEWHIQANEGKATQPTIGAIEQIDLNNTVTLQRLAKPNVSPIHLKTEALRYMPQKQYAESDVQVTMTKPGLQIIGTGMRAFLEQNLVELLHNVQTFYAPQP